MKKLLGVLLLLGVFLAAQACMYAQDTKKEEKKGEMMEKKGKHMEKKGEMMKKEGEGEKK